MSQLIYWPLQAIGNSRINISSENLALNKTTWELMGIKGDLDSLVRETYKIIQWIESRENEFCIAKKSLDSTIWIEFWNSDRKHNFAQIKAKIDCLKVNSSIKYSKKLKLTVLEIWTKKVTLMSASFSFTQGYNLIKPQRPLWRQCLSWMWLMYQNLLELAGEVKIYIWLCSETYQGVAIRCNFQHTDHQENVRI